MRRSLSTLLTVVFSSIVLVVGWLKRDQLLTSFEVVREIPAWTLLLLAGLFVLTLSLAALTYYMLALKPVRYRELLVVELAAAGANRLVPSGVGSMGIHGVYLHRRGHAAAAIATVVGTNNALGIATHLVLLSALWLIWPETLREHTMKLPVGWTIAVVCVLVLAAVLCSLPRFRNWLTGFIRDITRHFSVYKHQPHKIVLAALLSASITIVNLSIFAFAAAAVGVQLDLMPLFFVYSTGVLAGTATPTPGGLGGVEAGLVAGLIVFNVPAAMALASAVTFRLATFWWPILIGTCGFVVARQKKLL